MIDFDRIRAVKRDAQARLLKIPGVHAVAIGPKVAAGKSTQDSAIIVYVVKKRSPGEISPEELIPPEIDGIKTDVIEEDLPTLGGTLEGGLKISRPDDVWGTLGCIATSPDKSKVYALTCCHLVLPRDYHKQPLQVTPTTAGNSISLLFSGSVAPQTLIYVNFSQTDPSQPPELGAYYTTTGSESLTDIAIHVSNAVNDMTVTGVTASPSGALVDIDFPAGYQCTCDITRKTNPDSDLHASISDTTITFSGKVSGDYGVFTSINPGGVEPSYGVFAVLNKGDEMEDVANAVAASVDSMHILGIDVTSSGATVTIESPMEIDVIINSDVRIGQPRVCSICSTCCGSSIGTVDQARLDVDAAVIELEPGTNYFADQLNLGPIKNYYAVQDYDVNPGPYPVKKSGARTGVTHGNLTALDRAGYNDTNGRFLRQYFGAMAIALDDPNPNVHRFADRGDSGSALLNSDDELIGIVFANTSGGGALATPIQSITSALDIIIATAQTAGQTQTVPPYARSMLAESRTPIVGGMPISKSILDAQEEILATPAGKEYSETISQHASEVQNLINTNRRVATVWQRSGGPQIIQAALGIIQRRDLALPALINDKPLADCISKIQKVLTRYASPSLAASLGEYAPRIASFAGLTYAQMLARLKAPQGVAAHD